MRERVVLGMLVTGLIVILGAARYMPTEPAPKPWSADIYFKVKVAMKDGKPSQRVIVYTRDQANRIRLYEHEGAYVCDVNATEHCRWPVVFVNKIIDGQVTRDLTFVEVRMKHTDQLEGQPSITMEASMEDNPLSVSAAEPVATSPGALFDRVIHISSPRTPR